MSAETKAVFLSYASQDVEAALRIADALRAAGVEVWFDQSELVGGDQWDAKIRKQIGSCALFVPIISANTQARAEGYFRLEWKLADRRTDLIGKSKAFLLPVCIDDTRDSEADVPDSFTAVQWTRLKDGETTPAFVARVKKLLGGPDMEAGRPRPATAAHPGIPAPGRKIYALLAVAALVMAGATGWWLLRDRDPAAAASAPRSEAGRLAEQARALIYKPGAARAELEAAEELCKKAAGLDPTDAEVLATWSQACTWFVFHGFDGSSDRREAARAKAARALQLAPDSFEARFAQAFYLVRGSGNRFLAEQAGTADDLLRGLLRDRPDEPRALLVLAYLHNRTGRIDDARAVLERLVTNPAFAATAWGELGWIELTAGNYAAAEAAVDRAKGSAPIWRNLVLESLLAMEWRGDRELALATQRQLPASVQLEDIGTIMACYYHALRREPDRMLQVLEAMPRDWFRTAGFDGPKAYWAALAHEQRGDRDRADAQWRFALKHIETELAERPTDMLQLQRAHVLAALGEPAEAGKALRLVNETAVPKMGPWIRQNRYVLTLVRLGPPEAALDYLEKIPWLTAAVLRHEPQLDPLRNLPRFQALQARLEADPSRSPVAIAAVVPAKADEKSVAVLAFANLSDDKGNEYFSDGISEELLNVLAKVPGLKVAARTSAFYFKGKEVPVPEIARQLGVAYVVEGSVRKAGDKVRITAQLIKAADGFHVWSETFTRDLKDIFAVQDEIAALIAQNLRTRMAMTRERSAPDPEVYALILRARHAKARETNDGAREAGALYQQALAREPKSADAWAELALSYVQLGRFGGLPTAEGMREARIAARRALELDAEHPLGLLALAWVQRTNDRDWRGAITSFRRALAAAPENVTIMSDASICFLNVGFVAEAEALAAQAVARDPLNARAQWSLGAIYLWSGRPILAVDSYRRASELAPSGDEYHSHLSRALAMAGRFPEALQEAQLEPNERYRLVAMATFHYYSGDQAAGDRALQEIVAKYGDSMSGYLANLSAAAGKNDDVFRWLERGYETRDAAMAWIKTNAAYRSVTSDPRWEPFLRKMGLADDQLQ